MKFFSIIFLIFQLIFIVETMVKNNLDSQPERMYIGRQQNPSIEQRFSRGRCPQYFYQIDEECVFLANDGKIYSSKQVERTCAGRIARMVEQMSNLNPSQPNMKPTKGIRPLTLNSPKKTEILRAFLQFYEEQNFAVRLPSDYNTLRRCNDGQDDKWPSFCLNPISPNASCFETAAYGIDDICVREVECDPHYLRLACEFTLPGSPEVTNSLFRNCPARRTRTRFLPIWAWISIIVAIFILVIIIISAIIAIRKRSNKSKPKHFPGIAEREVRTSPGRKDPSSEPMIDRKKKEAPQDTGYLQPEPVETQKKDEV